jgi:Major Facilitator Superfamily
MTTKLVTNPQVSVYIRVSLYSLLGAMTAYVNSSFLGSSGISQTGINITYILVSLFGLISVWHLALYRYSISTYSKISIFFVMGIALATGLLGFFGLGPILVVLTLFVLMGSESPMFFIFDELLEHVTVNAKTALTRSHYLIAQNLCWILSPLLGMWLIESTENLSIIYIIGFALSLLLLTYSVYVYTHVASEAKARETKHLRFEKKTIPGLISHFALYTFYAAMISILPIYLNTHLDWSWLKIGGMFAIALTAFPLVQFPAGKLLNKYHKEEVTIPVGLGIIGLFLMLFVEASYTAPTALIIALFFMTRVGAGLTEVSNESYIFKRITFSHRSTIAVFRSMSPLSFFLVPIFWYIVHTTSIASFLISISWFILIVAGILAIYFIHHHKNL